MDAPPQPPAPQPEPKRKGRKPKQPEEVKFKIIRKNVVVRFD
jgi:hypothetical protein